MDYEEKYKEALERAKDCLVDDTITSTAEKYIEAIFPELCESEDERVRKALIHLINEQDGFLTAINGISVKDIIAWLKQYGENPASSEPFSEKELAETYLRVLDKKFPILPTLKGKHLADYKNFLNRCQQIFGLQEWGIHPTQSKLFEKLSLIWAVWGAEHLKDLGNSDNEDPCHTCDHPVLSCNDFPCEEKRAEQKPAAWSEEDEKMLKMIDTILFKASVDAGLGTIRCPYDDARDWLKSLRPQPHWKPSEEQMETLEASYSVLKTHDTWSEDKHLPLLLSLYNDLKKL